MRSMLTTLLLADAVHKYSEDQPRAANGEFGEGGESTPKVGDSKAVLAALKDLHGHENVLSGKGGFWIKNHGHISLAQARSQTGIKAPEREFRGRQQPWGEYAWIAGMNRGLGGKK